MLRTLARRADADERGFTLIELLVVILIIGILAAIALPAFLGQRSKGQDSSAKSDARNLVSQVESCFTDSQDYGQCTNTELKNTGLSLGASTGQVTMQGGTTNGFSIAAFSKSGNTFSIVKGTNGEITRSCNTAGSGSCLNGGSW